MSEGGKTVRYDPATEKEVQGWLKELVGVEIKGGQRNMELGLKNGVHLVNLAEKVQSGTPDCPDKARKMRLKANTLNAPFKQMENITTFLSFCDAYGVPKTCQFQTVDLYEGRNMAQVLSCIQALGTEGQRHGHSGMNIGPAPADRKRSGLSLDKIRASHGIIGSQSGTNQYASQKGMTAIGAVRHGSDIRADKNIDEKSATISSQQLGTNIFSSQKGMTSMGAHRHGADIRADVTPDPNSANVTNQQLGTNTYASQKGMMAIGAVRHGGDIRADDCNKDGEGLLPSQSGTNQFASQKGMTAIGGVRHGGDINIGPCSDEGNTVIGGQYGSNQFATQKGMKMGATRHIGDIRADQYDPASAGIMGHQSGDFGYATQSHMRIGGVRHGADTEVVNQCEYSSFFIPSQSGSNKFANQKGMRIGGVRHGADIGAGDLYAEAVQHGQDMGWDD